MTVEGEITQKPPDADPETTAAVQALMTHIVQYAENLGVIVTDINLVTTPEKLPEIRAWYRSQQRPN